MLQNMSDKVAPQKSAATGDKQTHKAYVSAPAESGNGEPEIWWECQRCTACCRWPGFVRVEETELAAIAHYLGMNEAEFIQHYTRLRPDRQGLALIDKPSGACHFLEGNDCSINDVKPEQCRSFPNRWNFPGWRSVCEAIPRPISTGEVIAGP